MPKLTVIRIQPRTGTFGSAQYMYDINGYYLYPNTLNHILLMLMQLKNTICSFNNATRKFAYLTVKTR